MKNIRYKLMPLALAACIVTTVNAQNWRYHNAGIIHGMQPKAVYGDGTSIIVTNASAFNGPELYYTPDSSTSFTACTSSFGTVSTIMETPIVKCMGVLFLSTASGTYKSHDAGHTWSQTAQHSAAYTMYTHNDTLYAAISGLPKMSTDTGNTWSTFGYAGTQVSSIYEYNGMLYIGSTSGLQYTSDFGTTWHSVSTPAGITGVPITSIAGLNGNIYAACSNGIFKSADNGGSWSNVVTRSTLCLTAIDTSILSGTAAGGTDGGGLYQSDKSGTTWTLASNGLPHVGSISYSGVNNITYNVNFILASTLGDSVLYIASPADLGLNPTSSTTAVQPSAQQQPGFDLMPNPAANMITVAINNASAEKVSITLFDIAGHKIKTSDFKNGSTMKIDLTNVIPGMYFVQIRQGTLQLTKKLEVIK